MTSKYAKDLGRVTLEKSTVLHRLVPALKLVEVPGEDAWKNKEIIDHEVERYQMCDGELGGVPIFFVRFFGDDLGSVTWRFLDEDARRQCLLDCEQHLGFPPSVTQPDSKLPANVAPDSYHLDAAREMAYRYHDGQVRNYTGRPYTEHLEAVACRTSLYLNDPIDIAAALLHAVVEDTDAEFSTGEWASPRSTLYSCRGIVFGLTNDHDKDWPRAKKWQHNYKRLTSAGSIVQTIKICDVMDNVKDIMRHDRSYGVRYLAEKYVLILGLREAVRAAFVDGLTMIISIVNETLKKEEKSEFHEYVGTYTLLVGELRLAQHEQEV